MTKIETKHFGEVEYDPEKAITFENGIPGFPQNKKYVLLSKSDQKEDPFCWLQSIENGDLAFAVASPFIFYPKYQPVIEDEEVRSKLDTTNPDDLTVLNILVIPEDARETTINLKAPLLINSKNRKGAQILAENEEYDIRHRICHDVKAMFE